VVRDGLIAERVAPGGALTGTRAEVTP
jgi:hypothetical protein